MDTRYPLRCELEPVGELVSPLKCRLRYSQEELDEATRRVALDLKLKVFPNLHNPMLLGIEDGGLPFFFSLLRKLDLFTSLDYSTTVPGYLPPDCWNRDIILVDDLLHTGDTLREFESLIKEKDLSGIKLCTVVLLRHRRVDPIGDFQLAGLELPLGTKWLVGFGLDWNSHYRNLNSIYELESDFNPGRSREQLGPARTVSSV